MEEFASHWQAIYCKATLLKVLMPNGKFKVSLLSMSEISSMLLIP
jgi:hypothetical protein